MERGGSCRRLISPLARITGIRAEARAVGEQVDLARMDRHSICGSQDTICSATGRAIWQKEIWFQSGLVGWTKPSCALAAG